MGEYEENYPEAYGRREPTKPAPRQRHFLGLGLPRQVRDPTPLAAEGGEAPERTEPRRPPPHETRHVERPRRPLVERTPQEICDDIAEQLAASPFIDASGVSIVVNGSEVTLEGTINSLIAISLAQALASNVPGVSRVQVRLRVQPPPRVYPSGG